MTKFIFVTGGRGQLGRQGDRGGLDRADAEEPGRVAVRLEAGPVPERGPGDDVAVPARRGVRHRRRVGDGPGPGSLRAVYRPRAEQLLERHVGADLQRRYRAREEGGVSRRHDPVGASRHGRHQGQDHRSGGGEPGRGDRSRGGRHGWGHRGAAVPRGDPTDAKRGRKGQRLLHPRHVPAIHQDHWGAEDQADPAQREGAAGHRNPARRDPVPQRRACRRRDQGQDRGALRRGPTRGRRGADGVDGVRGAAPARRGRPGGPDRREPRPLGHAEGTWPSGARWSRPYGPPRSR